jgi:glycosyltransferase involved in cell wall biosynthesis
MMISVLIPTYQRPKDLKRCLEALKEQTRPADEIIVVVRETDTETWNFIKSNLYDLPPLLTTKITIPGVVGAMNQGLDLAKGDVVCFTDDDAAPHKNWLDLIENHFIANNQIGGVGGRDFIYIDGKLWEGKEKIVGQLLPFGKIIHNHHLGIGVAREADVLKGVNMSFRREAILNKHFDTRMLGSGAQVHFEVEFCLWLKKEGWILIYDPQVAVDHYLGERFDEDKRKQFNSLAFFNEVHNETLALLEHSPTMTKILFVLWSFLIGHRKAYGILQLFRFLPAEGILAIQKWRLSIRGRIIGVKTWLTQR